MHLNVDVNNDKALDGIGDYVEGRVVAIIRIPGGMQSGRSSVTLRIETPDGKTILTQLSLSLLNFTISAFNAADRQMDYDD